MSDLKPRGIGVKIGGGTRYLLFTLNTIDTIQDKTGKSLSDVMDDISNVDTGYKTLREVVTVLLNDEADRSQKNGGCIPEVTEKEVGEFVGLDNYYEVVRAVFRAYGISLPEPEENDPNLKSGQTSS